MNLQERQNIIEQFFTLDKPCPDSIKDCEQVRDDYKKRLEILKSQPGCSSCKLRSLRNIITTQILSNNNL
jgi:hypothetical protein